MYTDDMVIDNNKRDDLQQAFDKLRVWAKENTLKLIN
jgi:hypothetical protein